MKKILGSLSMFRSIRFYIQVLCVCAIAFAAPFAVAQDPTPVSGNECADYAVRFEVLTDFAGGRQPRWICVTASNVEDNTILASNEVLYIEGATGDITMKHVDVAHGYILIVFRNTSYGISDRVSIENGQSYMETMTNLSVIVGSYKVRYTGCDNSSVKAVLWDSTNYDMTEDETPHCVKKDNTNLGVAFEIRSAHVDDGYKLITFRDDNYSGRAMVLFDRNMYPDIPGVGRRFEVMSYLLVPSIALERVEQTTSQVTLTYSDISTGSRSVVIPTDSENTTQFQVDEGYIQYLFDGEWKNLVALSQLKGNPGKDGDNGVNGRDGEQGPPGPPGQDGGTGVVAQDVVMAEMTCDHTRRGVTRFNDRSGLLEFCDGSAWRVQAQVQATCDYTTRGVTRFNAVSNLPEFCDSYEWRSQAASTSSSAGYIGDLAELGSANSPGGWHQCAITDSGGVRCWKRDGSQWDEEGKPEPDFASMSQVASGHFHSCVLDREMDGNGYVRCWGRSGARLDDVPDEIRPPDPDHSTYGEVKVKQISAGGDHTCALDENGHVRCWGTQTTAVPVLEAPDEIRPPDPQHSTYGTAAATKISAGGWHTCALYENGRVRCWGAGRSNTGSYPNYGQSIPPSEFRLAEQGGPTNSAVTAVQISSGDWHTCAVDSNGHVHCWGLGTDSDRDEDGGDGEDHDQADPPSELKPGGAITVTKISAGGFHTCALDNSSHVRCWGLGEVRGVDEDSSDGEDYDQAVPLPELGPGGTVTAKEISAGGFHTCVVDGSDHVRCWGNSSHDRLNPPDEISPSEVGSATLGTDTAAQISAGNSHTCAVTGNGGVVCWGLGTDLRQDEDGNSNNDDYNQAAPPAIVIEPVRQIATGKNHACVVDATRHVHCWGDDGNSQSSVPASLGQVRQVIAGEQHTCALTVENDVRCWGSNDFDQREIENLGKMRQIAAGVSHTCGINFNNTVHCRGKNTYGQVLGHEALDPALGRVRQIAAGWAFTCALTVKNRVRCWGRDNHGQQEPSDLGTMRQIAAGLQFTCGIKMDDTVHCWGAGDMMEETTKPNFRQSIPSLELTSSGTIRAKRITAGQYHACVLTMSDNIKCWGGDTDETALPGPGEFDILSGLSGTTVKGL